MNPDNTNAPPRAPLNVQRRTNPKPRPTIAKRLFWASMGIVGDLLALLGLFALAWLALGVTG